MREMKRFGKNRFLGFCSVTIRRKNKRRWLGDVMEDLVLVELVLKGRQRRHEICYLWKRKCSYKGSDIVINWFKFSNYEVNKIHVA